MAYNVVIADKISSAGLDFLSEQSDVNDVEAFLLPEASTQSAMSEAEGLLVRSETQVTREFLDRAPRLKVIGRAGVGIDNIDLDAATERGIIVINAPSGNTIATAELTFTHMLCSARPVVQAHTSMQSGAWDRQSFKGIELSGKTLGIIGLGRIGTEVAARARAFGMQVLAYDPYITEMRAKTLEIPLMPLDELLPQADFITLHIPLTETTRHILNAEAFSKMKPGVRVFNGARGGLVDEEALQSAISEGKVSWAGLDVFESEPLPADSPLRQSSQMLLTPHLGASTEEAQENVGLEAAKAVVDVLRGGIVRNGVNFPSVDARTLECLRPYLSLGRKMGRIFQQILPDQIQKLSIRYWGKITELNVLPVTRSIQCGYLQRICGAEVNDVNAPIKLRELGIEVEAIKSNEEQDYSELIELEAYDESGASVQRFSGTLMGPHFSPRIVSLGSREIEFHPQGILLIVENEDVPGIVGMLGQVLGEDQVNIANMSLSRGDNRAHAVSVFELDSLPGAKALKKISEHPNIRNYRLVEL